MHFVKIFFNFYIYSNIHVALAAFSLTKITLLAYGIHENVSPFFVFFATVVSYNFIISFDKNKIDFFSMSWIKAHKKIWIILNVVSIVFLIVCSFSLRFSSILVLVPFTITTLLYIVPYQVDKKNLRSMASLKLFLITATWAGITVLFPLIQNEVPIDSHVWMIFFQRSLFILAITIPFDIRDMQDDQEQLKTIPQLFGIFNSKFIAGIALFLLLILEFFTIPFDAGYSYRIILIVFVSFLFVVFSKENQNRYFTAFWIEALPIFWFLLVLF